MDQISTLPALPIRPENAHKGTFGSVAVVGGSIGAMPEHARMLGAPSLAANGAIRSGCGLVRVAVPEAMLDGVLSLCPFATGYALAVGADGDPISHECAPVLDRLFETNDALVIGPGLGAGDGVTKLVLRAIAQDLIPVVIDADAISALCGSVDFAGDLFAPCVLTPHPGEAQRLCGALNISCDPAGTDEQRIDACTHIAQRLGSIVVLKGNRTVVSDGHGYWVCERGHPCLASAGTGDVLAGMIGSLLAQHGRDRTLTHLQCAIAGVHAHAIAGERWSAGADASGGMTAVDLCNNIPGAIETLRES